MRLLHSPIDVVLGPRVPMAHGYIQCHVYKQATVATERL